MRGTAECRRRQHDITFYVRSLNLPDHRSHLGIAALSLEVVAVLVRWHAFYVFQDLHEAGSAAYASILWEMSILHRWDD